jgi:eukaryotic-like serine/threonine-protein kinase
MNLQLREGQVFPKQYVLSKRSASDAGSASSVESWIATHNQTGDRVLVRFMTTRIDDDTWSSISKHVSTLRGLVHQNISLNVEAGVEDGIQYLVEPYLTDSQILDLDDPKIWPLLQQMLGALGYAHNLGITHGTLNPGNIMVDASGIVHITGFALPPSIYSSSERAYLSPQVLAGRDPGIDDDIYSLGCILFRALTGKSWKKDVELDLPLDSRLESQLRAMLSEVPFERPTDLAELRELLGNYFEGSSTAIESVAFSRRSASTPETTTTSAPDLIGKRQDEAIPLQRVLLAGAFLLVFAAILFAFLPTSTPTESAAAQNSPPVITAGAPGATSAAPPVVTPLESARLEMFQKQGEELTREILRQQLALEDAGVIFWARTEYDNVIADLDAAENMYRERQFETALDQYKSVLARLAELKSLAPGELEKHIALGDKALLEGDAETALTSFTIATSIDRESNDLQNKLARAETLDQVQDLVRQAEAFERNGEFDHAYETFKTAKDLDSEWKPAKKGLARIQRAITQRSFQIAMSTGFQGIANKDYDAAREGFTRAKKILPDSVEPEDGLLQVEQSERNDIILGHQRDAEALLASEDWTGAIEEYESALAIADSLEFAVTGLAYAKSRLALQERLQEFLSDPTLLQSNEGLAEASATLRQASRAKPATDQMLYHINILARLISTARIEIPVTINSDGNTDVTVRRHAELGKVTNKVVYLIPGRYTVVGQRPGYRDVREDLVVLAGEPSPTLQIASTERVR